MNLTISGHHLDVSPALRSYVTTKLDRITRHFDQVVDVKVILTVEKQKEKERRQKAECNIHVKGSDMFAESVTLTFMPPWTTSSTSSTARSSSTRTDCRITITRRPSA